MVLLAKIVSFAWESLVLPFFCHFSAPLLPKVAFFMMWMLLKDTDLGFALVPQSGFVGVVLMSKLGCKLLGRNTEMESFLCTASSQGYMLSVELVSCCVYQQLVVRID